MPPATRRQPPLALLAVLLLGTAGAAPGKAEDAALAARIEGALSRLGPHAIAAVRVLSLTRGQVLCERNPDLSLNPASNMKLITSAAALAKLGPDYRFTTRVLATAPPTARGVVRGDLALQGGGDPVLETADLDRLAAAIQAAGVRRVTGRLLADDSRYDAERLGSGWSWDDEPFYFSAQVSALGVNRNVLTVQVIPAHEGEPARVELSPVPDYLRVTERPVTGAAGSETRVRVTRERGRNEVRVSGAVAAGGEPVLRAVTMEEPALCAASLFRRLLAERGIRIRGGTERGPAPAGAVEMAAHASRPLRDIAALLNKPSDNPIAEMLLKELGAAAGRPGSAAAGAAAVIAWLREIGLDTGGLRIADGSGLSRMDLLTSRVLSDLLAYADRQPWREAFVASLPVAGVDGTLRSRLRGTGAENNLRAKTGSLSRVSALAGYVTAASGERLVVSILVNNYPGANSTPAGAKRVEDAIVALLAE